MVTDCEGIVRNLTGFYDFADKRIVAVGAGGGQFSEYARRARHVVAVDFDPAACSRLREVARKVGLERKFTILETDFLAVRAAGDLVLFEFCLHQMPDPRMALAHASRLAREIVVIDHAPGSSWEWYAGEERKVETAWSGVAEAGPLRTEDFSAVQRFENFAALEERFASQGATSASRIASLRGLRPIEISMPYRLALLEHTGAYSHCHRMENGAS